MAQLGRHVLAAYYNDARVNILYCLNDVREKLRTGNVKPIEDEAQILNALDGIRLATGTPERSRAALKLLRRRFRFMDAALDVKPDSKQPDKGLEDPRRYEALLRRTFVLITEQRNALVHPTHPKPIFSHPDHKALFFDLGKVYDAALNEVGKRFSLAPETLEPLRRLAVPPRGGSKGKGRGRSNGKGGGQEGKKSTPKPRETFSLALCRDPETTRDQQDIQQSQVLHDFGHVLLCALFLDKTQVAELADHLWKAGYDRDWTAQQQAMVRELMGVYRVHLPLRRLLAHDSRDALTIDVLSELSRCPRPLFEALGPADQARFRVGTPELLPAAALAPDGGEADGEDEDGEASGLMVRSNRDRFVPLMMRFLDQQQGNKLRFAVDLGQYFHSVRYKPGDHFTDGDPRVRRLGRKVVAYGRLGDFQTAPKPETWQRLVANAERSGADEVAVAAQAGGEIVALPPYLVACEPHYHFSDDRIGLRIEGPQPMAAYPDLAIASPDATELKAGRPSGRAMEPEFWLAPEQLLDLGLYAYLQPKASGFRAVHVVLIDYRKGMAALIESLANGGPALDGEPGSTARKQAAQAWLDALFAGVVDQSDRSPNANVHGPRVLLKDLPEVVRRHLLSSQPGVGLESRVRARLEALIDDTERRQRQLDNLTAGFKKRGKKGFRPIKCGVIGDFLAEDLMRFQPPDEGRLDTGGGKLNSQQYQILQAALAFYARHLEEPPRISQLLADAGLLAGPQAHPFLDRLGLIDKPDKFPGLLSFYKAYLAQRMRFLERFRRDLERGQGAAVSAPRWLRLRQESSLESWLDGYRSPGGAVDIARQPLPVSRGLLRRPLLAMIARALGTTPEALAAGGSRQHVPGHPEADIPPSVTWLLKCYLEHEGQSAQDLYALPRHYDLFDTHLDERGNKGRFRPKPQHALTDAKRKAHRAAIRATIKAAPEGDLKARKLQTLASRYERQERRIARLMAQDGLLYLYAQDGLAELLLREDATRPVWPLKDMGHTLLGSPIRYVLPVPGTQRLLVHPACKVRNLGELRLLARDKRLPSLLDYYPPGQTELDQGEVRAELASYRRARVEVMKRVHRLENALHRRLGGNPELDPQQLANWVGRERHAQALLAVSTLFGSNPVPVGAAEAIPAEAFSRERFQQALEIRNAFSHNRYAEAALFPGCIAAVARDPIPANPTLHRKVAERLLAVLDELYAPWLRLLSVNSEGVGRGGEGRPGRTRKKP